MNKVTAVIVDDELAGRKATENLLMLTNSPVELLGVASSVEEASDLIQSKKPELIFLDIQLRKQTGFDLLDRITNYPFEVIFITAYDQYAIDAFKRQAISYLLKPVDPEEFKTAVDRAAKLILAITGIDSSKNQLNKYEKILSNTLPVSKGSEIEYIKTSTIIYAEADGSYAIIYLKDNTSRVVSRNLKHLQEKLSKSEFVRPHRSFLVNIAYINKHDKTNGGSLLLSNGAVIPVSNKGRQKLQEIL